MEQPTHRVLAKFAAGPIRKGRYRKNFQNQIWRRLSAPQVLTSIQMGPIRQEVAKNFPAQKFFRHVCCTAASSRTAGHVGTSELCQKQN
jgi:hypothetical protein